MVSKGFKPRKGSVKECLSCGKEVYRPPSLSVKKAYCSIPCFKIRKLRAKIIRCKLCSKQIRRFPSELKSSNFCSQFCVNNSRRIPENEKVTPTSEVGRRGKRMVGGVWSTKKADLEFSRYIRNRDGKCVACGKTLNEARLSCSHFWSRRHSATRYDPDNCDTLCWVPCHKYQWENEKQGRYREYMMKKLGPEGYNLLQKKALLTVNRKDAILAWMELFRTLEK